jgi:ElaB/YqjD/DUF883 family membrane-anchored ribosome-binding protein
MSSSPNQVVRLRDRLPADVSGQITDSLRRIAEQLAEAAKSWPSKAKSAAKSTDSLVRSNPWQTVGLVAVVSLAAGLLASRQIRQARLRRQAARNQQELAGG